jgi:hypothetical protein
MRLKNDARVTAIERRARQQKRALIVEIDPRHSPRLRSFQRNLILSLSRTRHVNRPVA